MDKNQLEALRCEIDKLDRDIAILLEKRMNLVSEISDYKQKTNTGILDQSREKKVIENVLSVVSKPSHGDIIKSIFGDIMARSRAFQQERHKQKIIKVKKYGLIGEHLSHSISPLIHRLFFEKAGVEGEYNLIEISKDKIPTVIEQLKGEGYEGVNVTIPYKIDVMRVLDSLSDDVKRIGAVNTIKMDQESIGFNTDYYGFGKTLDYYNINIKGKACAVLGSGGASKAIIACLEDKGASQIVVVSRDPDSINLKYPGLKGVKLDEFEAKGYDLVVNTTPVGMWPDTQCTPLDKNQLEGAGFIIDIIYNPRETMIMRLAGELGIPSANGLYMLVAQAIGSQEIWQKTTYGSDIINAIYEEIKNEK